MISNIIDFFDYPPLRPFHAVRSTETKKYDNSMLNSIKLICEDKSEISVDEGAWGQWDQQAVNCPKNTYLNGFQLKVQPSQGTEEDDTAANDIIMFCNGTQIKSQHYDDANFGVWSSIVMCPENMFIRGFNLQIEKRVPYDNTALNNVRMYCSYDE